MIRSLCRRGGAVQVNRTHKGPGHLPGARSIVRPLRGPTAGGAALCAVQAFFAGVPTRAQRSGSCGESRSKGADAVFAVRRKRSQADFATTRRRGGFAAPSISIQMGFPAGQGPLGLAAKARYEHHPAGPHPQSSEAAGDGRGGAAEGVSFRADAEANDSQLVPTRWSCTSN